MRRSTATGGAMIAALLCLPAGAGAAYADELGNLYRHAERSDPLYREAIQQRLAATEAVSQAQANLLPRVSLDASVNRQWQKIEAEGGSVFGGTQNVDFSDYRYSLTVRQPVYRRARVQQRRQADHTTLQAQAAEEAARQSLLFRVSDAYFNILSARADLDFVRAEKRALGRQLDQAKQRLELGLGTQVDVKEARAGYDQSLANELLAQNELATAGERMREITGDIILNHDLRLDPSMPLQPPEPDDEHYWVRAVRSGNPHVTAAMERTAAAEKAVEIARSDHQPSLDVVGRQSFQSSGGRFGDTDITGSTVGLEFIVPIYEGGGATSRVRQAQYELEAVRARGEQTLRLHERQTRETYLRVLNDIRRAEALEQAVLSARAALHSIQAGFDAGTRTSVDVVTAEQNLSKAQRDHTRARHSYVVNRLRLKRGAGRLQAEDLETMDRWLTAADTD